MIVGTTNPGKLREMAAICVSLGVSIESRNFDIPETGDTFEANAEIKVLAYSNLCPGSYVMSEDSGLIIPALDNLPGPWSARFSDFSDGRVVESNRSREDMDAANNEKVLDMMRDKPFDERAAFFIICLNVALDERIVFSVTTTGKHGWIATEVRGTNGFGYDPIFVGQDTFGKTYAELDAHRKNLRSHRNEALQQFEMWLAAQVQKGVRL